MEWDRDAGWTPVDSSVSDPVQVWMGNASTGTSNSNVPAQIHVSEFLKSVIEKQHEVERFYHASGAEVPHHALTKMAMMKTELDLLSSSITGLIGRVNATVDAGAGHSQYMEQVMRPQQIWPIVDAVPAPYPMEAQLPEAAGHPP